MMKKFFTVAALLMCSYLFSQDTVNKLDVVVITTNKYPVKQSATGKVVTVIDRNMLNNFGGRSVGEILNTVAGTTIIGANNPLGSNQRISVRGASDGNVLLLIDGIPANDPSVISNYFDLTFINTSQIEKIEILKGAQSTLYGSDAVAGVINIITKKASSDAPAPYGSISYGSFNTLQTNAGVRGRKNKFRYNGFASLLSSSGFSSAYDSTGAANYDKDGINQYTLRSDIGFELSNNVELSFFGNYSRYKADIDAAAFNDDKDFFIRNKNLQAGTSLHWRQKNGNLKFSYNYNHITRFYLDDSTDRSSFGYYSNSTYIGKTHYTELYNVFRKGFFEVLTGIDYRYFATDQNYFSVSMFGPFETVLDDTLAHMHQWSPYVSVVYNHAGLNIEAGGRLNNHSTFGSNSTYTFNPSYLVNNTVKLFTNIASAFKAPSLYQLFDPYSGNKDLSPERSTVFEGGIELFSKGSHLRTTYFSRTTNNAIQYVITDPAWFIGEYRNINKQENKGVEVEYNFTGDKWNINTNYTYTTGSIQSNYTESGSALLKDTTYNNLYRVPKHAVNAFLSYNVTPALSVNTLVKVAGKRWEPIYASAPRQLDSYYTIDLSGRYKFSSKLSAFADVKNITDQQYFEVLGYNTRRINFTAGVNLNL